MLSNQWEKSFEETFPEELLKYSRKSPAVKSLNNTSAASELTQHLRSPNVHNPGKPASVPTTLSNQRKRLWQAIYQFSSLSLIVSVITHGWVLHSGCRAKLVCGIFVSPNSITNRLDTPIALDLWKYSKVLLSLNRPHAGLLDHHTSTFCWHTPWS